YARLKAMSSDEIDRMGLLGDVHFDFDKADIKESERPTLNKNAEVLKKFDFLRITLEGHCDERGTVEYNLALGERRAQGPHHSPGSPGAAAGPPQTEAPRQGVHGFSGQTAERWGAGR